MKAANSNYKQTILAFIDRINAHDPEGLGELMSDDTPSSMLTATRSAGETK